MVSMLAFYSNDMICIRHCGKHLFPHNQTLLSLRLALYLAVALVKWLWEETHVPKVVGLNPSTIYWMDIFHIYLL